ncbi:hypothetical protein BKP45_14875 [Anaerobacillus alkalidiazotrophicus]|uniref:Uncharacterized protein n=1 Tax=Anaerobacillus alkalidiazotrophicus TaxID=472963 RepID=A0A1S2M2Z7_9BACI|nr:glycosyltransferase [Anaerobacillus alkalidiazotrophicus]OIJ19004.1 hypothetical protein BKP45_14875 [Anaerobacillus alkalidiazotrophicus]
MDEPKIMQVKQQSIKNIAFLTPYFKEGRGNATTARRIVTGLCENQVHTDVVAYDEQSISIDIVDTIERNPLLHILHFRRFSDWQEKNQFYLQTPYVITSGGTDVNIDIFKEEYKEKIGKVLRNAAAITVFSHDSKQKLLSVYKNLESKVHVIKQSVWLPEISGTRPKKTVYLSEDGFNIVLPAGLRVVKDVLYVLPALIELKQSFPKLTFTIVGSAIDHSILKAVSDVTKTHPWVSYYEDVPFEEMSLIYEQSDVIINSSFSEGQSSALLEAMFLKKPVVARNNGGNKSIIDHGRTGFLFENLQQFYNQIRELALYDELCQYVTENASEYVMKEHNLKNEITSYLHLYNEVLN